MSLFLFFMKWNEDWQALVETLQKGGIVVIPTDTLYGIVTSALNKSAVEKVYALRKRSPDKPVIVLVASFEQLQKFLDVSEKAKQYLEGVWPGSVSVVLPCDKKEYFHLHRGTNSIAFRMPADKILKKLLLITGPLIAPSANTEGMPPATTIEEAQAYFGDSVDVYVDGGKITGSPSRLVRWNNDGSVEILR